MATTYTATHKFHQAKLTGITQQQKQQMEENKIASAYRFAPEAPAAEKPAPVKPASPATADKTPVKQPEKE